MSQESSSQWCTIESDPGVFTSLIESFGVKNAELTELWSLDDDSLQTLGGKVYGLIFLFKWQRNTENTPVVCLSADEIPPELFFARQVTTNACATQAILSVLLNLEGEKHDVSLGPVLESLRNFTANFPPDLKGEAIGASEEIRTAHNSFARNESFLAEQKQRTQEKDDDVFHFIAYTPHKDGCVYELDGLQEGPVRVGKFTGDDDGWLPVARQAIQERIEKYAANEIKFNLMAVVRDKRLEMNEKLKVLEEAQMEEDILEVKAQLEAEEEKRNQWNRENERRRHNYLPFIIQLIKEVARSGKMEEMTTKANVRVAEQRKRVEGKKGSFT